MSNVTEDSLLLAAKSVVNDFTHDGKNLNEGVKKKASEMGLNKEQTARLIERTNAEAFLSVFPEKSEFEIADPNVILSGTAKTASAITEPPKSYIDSLNRDPYDIFGVSVLPKVASAIPSIVGRSRLVGMVYADAIEQQISIEKMAHDIKYEEAEERFNYLFKQACLQGRNPEEELLLIYPQHEAVIKDTVDARAEKLAKEFIQVKRAALSKDRVIDPTDVTDSFGKVITLAFQY